MSKNKWVNTDEAFVVHPDSQEWLMHYQPGRKFGELQEVREDIIDRGEHHHNTDHDEEMLQTAEERTLAAAMLGWKFPGRKK